MSMNANGKKLSLMERWLGAGGSGTDRLAKAVKLSLITFALLALSFVGMTWLLLERINSQRDLGTVAVTWQRFQTDLLQMRRAEKDFLARKTKEELEKHQSLFNDAKSALARLQALEGVLGAEGTRTLGSVTKSVEDYRKAFVALSERQVALGLDESSGIQGKLRSAIHNAEDLILKQGAPELEAGLLTLRRHEKDFILREREEYVTRFAKGVEDLSRALAMSRLDAGTRNRASDLLGTYAAGFREFVAGTQALNQALSQAREAAHAAEEPVATTVADATQRRDHAAALTKTFLYALGSAFTVVLLGLAALLYATKRAADSTLAERLAAQQKAEAENEALNNSVISILQAMHQLSQRDLTAKAPVTQDVIGTVSDSINMLTDETARVLHGVTRIADQVEQVSGKVKSQADNVSRTAEDERRSVQQMIVSLDEASHTMTQVATLAQQSNNSAEQATEATVEALQTVNGTVKGMESIRETIAETEKRIKRLGERSQEITGIVNLINTISERTHVLALNASMQAAVAGEAGRGFAVVAEEVQRLAESSRNATQQIATLVSNIQLETNETINTVNRTIGQVVQGSEQAQKAGEQMRRTQEITAQLVALVRRIAETSDRQKEMSQHLLQSVQHIGRSTERTAEQITAQNQETETLLQSARELVQSVNVFKLPQFA
jgi:methyl-accepting chemotaxis protein